MTQELVIGMLGWVAIGCFVAALIKADVDDRRKQRSVLDERVEKARAVNEGACEG
jgi:hypothetical protein